MSPQAKGTLDEYRAPATLAEAAEALADGKGTVLAGGTDLMLQAEAGKTPYRGRLVNIRRVAGLRGVTEDGGTIRIGALTTVTDLLNDPLVAEKAPVLAATADKFASSQIRNAATVGGNICNASPAGDMILPLLALDARVELASWRDGALATRTVALDGFFTGPGATVKGPEELLGAVLFETPPAGRTARFVKSGPRPALEIATVAAAIAMTVDGGTLRDVRLALGAVAPTPLRAKRTEALLEGETLDGDLIARAAETVAGEVNPIDDVRATAWYRKHLVTIYVRRLLQDDGKG
ncbi:MAG: xanthine dehydrogenase family protein subunit M [Hyphomicrobiales bacterium]|nr:xanthine dehydrogenase family protein subunit M [Hyphomicrobiales bacterium]MCP5374439.1 xanthine dehydrogenase family protein subunit M [Hyphomicrobiales bacterium]